MCVFVCICPYVYCAYSGACESTFRIVHVWLIRDQCYCVCQIAAMPFHLLVRYFCVAYSFIPLSSYWALATHSKFNGSTVICAHITVSVISLYAGHMFSLSMVSHSHCHTHYGRIYCQATVQQQQQSNCPQAYTESRFVRNTCIATYTALSHTRGEFIREPCIAVVPVDAVSERAAECCWYPTCLSC